MARSRRAQRPTPVGGGIKKPRTSPRKSKAEEKELINKIYEAIEEAPSTDEGDDTITTFRSTRTVTLRSSSLTTCIVCLEPHLYDAFPNKRLTSKCRHKSQVCSTCLETSLRTQFTTKMYDQLSCPDCNARLSANDVQTRAPADLVQQYKEIVSVFQKCRHGKCKGGRVVNTAMEKVFTCTEWRCGKSTCVRCDDKAHEGKTCAQNIAQRSKKGERESEKWMDKKTRLCPYEGCAVRIEKDGGCDHMFCSRCSRAFCYRCMGVHDQKLGHIKHGKPCVVAV